MIHGEMKLLRIAFVVCAVLAARGIGGVIASGSASSYEITESCGWRTKWWASWLNMPQTPPTSQEADDAEWACHHRRGQKSRSPHLKTVMQKWPS